MRYANMGILITNTDIISHRKENLQMKNNKINEAAAQTYFRNHATHFTHSTHFLTRANAFTLAETLITLAIIGIVAALTLPSVIQKYQEKVTITKLKKIYAELSQAYTQEIAQNGEPKTWTISTPNEFMDIFAKYLKMNKKCAPNTEGCWYNKNTIKLNGSNDFNFVTGTDGEGRGYATAQLVNGTLLAFAYYDNSCTEFLTDPGIKSNVCSQIIVDINGYNTPNQFGKDIFTFLITDSNIYPRGTANTISTVLSFEHYCYNHGHSCAAWVIQNENMDYLHCDDLSWNGKHKCSDD